PECLPGGPIPWRAVLVWLPYQPRPHPQALSRTHGDSLAGAVRGDSADALARAETRAGARPGDAGARLPSRPATLAQRAGGARALARGARWGVFHAADSALRSGRLWQNHPACRLGEPAPGTGRLALAGRAGQYANALLGLAHRRLAQ